MLTPLCNFRRVSNMVFAEPVKCPLFHHQFFDCMECENSTTFLHTCTIRAPMHPKQVFIPEGCDFEHTWEIFLSKVTAKALFLTLSEICKVHTACVQQQQRQQHTSTSVYWIFLRGWTFVSDGVAILTSYWDQRRSLIFSCLSSLPFLPPTLPVLKSCLPSTALEEKKKKRRGEKRKTLQFTFPYAASGARESG